MLATRTTPSPIRPAAGTTGPPPPMPGTRPAPSSPPISKKRDEDSSGGSGAAGELAEGAIVADGGFAGALGVLVVQPGADRGGDHGQHAAPRGQAAPGGHPLGAAREQLGAGAAGQLGRVRAVRGAEPPEP